MVGLAFSLAQTPNVNVFHHQMSARRPLSEEIFRAEMSTMEARRIYPDVVLGLRIRKLDREIARLGEAHKAAVAEGDPERSQEMFTAQKAARIEKERLMRERRMRI